MPTKPTPKYPGHNARAAELVRQAIEARLVVSSGGARHDHTCGPYSEAVDRGIRFAVISWATPGSATPPPPQVNCKGAQEAADTFVSRVGSTRANEAARRALKRAGKAVA